MPPAVPFKSTSDVFPHFRDLKFAENINEQNKKIDLLIGADCYHKFLTDEIIRGKEGEPVAQNTFFVWVLSGNIFLEQK